jgi:multidrug efflux pump subunit AcrA (membrane-fusion protein)
MRYGQRIAAAGAKCLASLAVVIAPSVIVAMAQDARNVQAPREGVPAVADKPANPAPAAQTILDAPATVQAFFATDLYAKDSGYVLHVDADIGDHVKAGQVLAVIDDPELQMQFVRAEVAVQQASAALEVTKRRVVGMEADLALQRVTLKRQEQLFTSKVNSNQQLDEQRAKEGVSSSAVDVGRADIALAEANLKAATADMNRIQTLLQYTKIVAPFDGVVTRRFINPGELVQSATSSRPATPLFTCQQLNVVRVFADVPEASATSIRQGQSAQVRLYGPTGQTISARVTRIAAALDSATRTMRVEIDLPNDDEKLLPGMYAQVSFGPATAASEAPVVGRSFNGG